MILSLRKRIVFLLAALIMINLMGAAATIWYTYSNKKLQTGIIETDIATCLAAQELLNAFMAQKGVTTYFFLSHDQKWLDELAQYHDTFIKELQRTRSISLTPEDISLLNQIESQYLQYDFSRQQVIHHYQEGRSSKGVALHWEIRSTYLKILDACRELQHMHKECIAQNQKRYIAEAGMMSLGASSGIIFSVIGGFILGWVLLRQVLDPIQQLVAAADGENGAPPVNNEVERLGVKVRALISDVSDVQKQLDVSKTHLVKTEKMALVGSLAAGVAHSIRTPLTSIKMRLFSLERSLDLSEIQREDFEVVSEEISHLETIVKTFLEFARRPKLKRRLCDPSEIVDTALRLVRHRLDSYDVEVAVHRPKPLPQVLADPEQLREVFLNLFLNACEAMVHGGSITITEEVGVVDAVGSVVLIRVQDTGPGISETAIKKVFEPFFSSKEEGSGLGLAIARSVVEEHGGWLHVHSEQGEGATFVIVLPYDRRA